MKQSLVDALTFSGVLAAWCLSFAFTLAEGQIVFPIFLLGLGVWFIWSIFSDSK